MTTVRVAGFSAKDAGFRFANAWPHNPIAEFTLGTVAKLTIGDAANGLCGGMSFAAADIFAAGLPRPTEPATPPAGTPKYDYIVRRQIDSFAGIWLPLRFYLLMSRTRPDREPAWAELLGVVGIDRHSRGYVMVHDEWPRIRQSLDAGRLAMLGLVSVVDDDPFKLSSNHQVVAHGYDLDGSQLTLHIYDPNWPNDDEVTLRLDVGDPRAAVTATYSKPGRPVVCFFRAPYSRADPLPWRP